MLTLATSDLGIWLNGKMVLYFGRFGKSENKALFIQNTFFEDVVLREG
jgi:hypothetical protein